MAECSSSSEKPGPGHAIVVLGCRVVGGQPGAALTRRLSMAAETHRESPHLPIIMSGGRAWDGQAECTVMAKWWVDQGLPQARVIEEAESQTTRENADRVAQLCERLGYRHVILVTCDFHMRRAKHLFEQRDLRVSPVPATKARSLTERARLQFREWGASLLGRWETLVR